MATIDPSELLTHAGWLRQLARSLVREDAEDLVQETWVAALRRPPERDGERSARPWLRTVLANAARLRWRGDKHRSAREQAVAAIGDAEAPSSAQLLERHELQSRLARLVGELDEPFRSAILLRFAEGMMPSQIAKHLAVPAGTVRWRIKEGLARLRAQLDDEHGGNRRAWIAAFAPLALPRSSRIAPAIAIAVAAGLAVAVAVIVIVIVRPSAFGETTSTSTSTSTAPAAPTRAAMSTPAMASASAASWLAQTGAPTRALRGRVVAASATGDAPVANAVVRLLGDPLPPRDVTTGADGRFDFGMQPPRAYVVGASQPGKLAAIERVDLRDPSARSEIELVLGDCVASLYGVVSDASGSPIAGAAILREGAIGTQTDAAGRYELCVLPTAALLAEIRIVVRAGGFGTIAQLLAPAGRVHHDFVLVPEATIVGRVVGGDGAPIADARVALDLTAPEAAVPPEHGITVAVMTDGDGRFGIAGLAAGEYRVSATSRAAIAAPIAVTVAAGDNREVELRTSATGTVRGRVLSAGRPVAGVTVAAGSEAAISQADGSFTLERVPVGEVELATAPYRRVSGAVRVTAGETVADVVVEPLGTLRGVVRRHGVPVPFARVDVNGPSKAGVTTDASGRYEIRGLAAGMYAYYCDDRRRGALFTEDRAVELAAGETRERDVELAWAAAIAGRVVDGRGDPVAGVAVRFRGNVTSTCITDAAGAFACGGLSGGTYSAAVFPMSGASHPYRFVDPPPTLELRDGEARIDDVRFVIEPTALAIAGTVVDASGAPVSDVAVRAFGAGRTPLGHFEDPPTAFTDSGGRFRIADLSAGEYLVEVERNAFATRRRTVAGTTNVQLVLDRPPCDSARGHELPPTFTRAPAPIRWSEHVELVGWSLPATTRSDAEIELTLVFRVLRPLDRDWRVFAHFDGALRVNADHEPAIGWCPTSSWKPGDTIVDRTPVRFAKPGRYALTIGLFGGKPPDWVHLPVAAVPPAMANAVEHGIHIADILVE